MTALEVAVLGTGVLLTAPVVAAILRISQEFLKSISSFLLDLIFPLKAVLSETGTKRLCLYLRKHGRQLTRTQEGFVSKDCFVRSERARRQVWFVRFWNCFSWYYYKGALILQTPNVDCANFRFLRGTVDWYDLIRKAAAENDQAHAVIHAHRFEIFTYHGSNNTSAIQGLAQAFSEVNKAPAGPPTTSSDMTMRWEGDEFPINYAREDLGPIVPDRPLEHLSLNEKMQSIVRDVKFWMGNKDWYMDRDIAWKRCYMLCGGPGVGKTSLIRGLAEELNVSVHLFDLSSMTNEEFLRHWANTRKYPVRIVAMEDVDTVFQGRENVSKNPGAMTFDTLLNAIDGIERENGLLLFVTTNRPEILDPALKRPGRADVIVDMPPLDHAGRLKICIRIVRDPLVARRLVEEGPDDTPAELTERAIAWAIDQLWKDAA